MILPGCEAVGGEVGEDVADRERAVLLQAVEQPGEAAKPEPSRAGPKLDDRQARGIVTVEREAVDEARVGVGNERVGGGEHGDGPVGKAVGIVRKVLPLERPEHRLGETGLCVGEVGRASTIHAMWGAFRLRW